MKRIAIDLVPIYPGHGGAGGGIYTYAKSLIENLDHSTVLQNSECTFYCLVNSQFDLELKNIKVVKFDIDSRRYFKRMLYVHIILPWYCLKNNISILHKLATEIPIFCTSDLVVTVHDFVQDHYVANKNPYYSSLLEKLRVKYFAFITNYALKKAKYIITPSVTIKNEAISKRKVPANKIFVAEPAAKKHPFNKRNFDKGAINIFYIAAYLPHKGHVKAIEIFELLKNKYNLNITLYFRGNGANANVFNDITQRISQSDYKNNINVIKYDKNSNLSDIYENADVMWQFSEYEGFGLPLLEAQIHGIPVICSDIPIFKEIATNSSALLINGDNGHIAWQINDLLSNEHQINKIVALGIENSSRFSWTSFASKILDVYKLC